MIVDAGLVIFAYLLGSVPTGLWLGLRLKNIDIREHGSKNIGATNTLRVLGKGLGAVALVCDMAKGAVPVLIAEHQTETAYVPLICGLAAILGHTFSLFLKFKGGKGVATSAGVFFALTPFPMAAALGTFIVAFAASRMVSLGSVLAAIVFGIAIWVLPNDIVLRCIGTLVAVIVVLRHRDNIKRIFSGTENKI